MHYCARKKFPEFYEAYNAEYYEKAREMLMDRFVCSPKPPSRIFKRMIFTQNLLTKNICPFFKDYFDALVKAFPRLALIEEDLKRGIVKNIEGEVSGFTEAEKKAAANPFTYVERDSLKNILEVALDVLLDDTERKVILYRFELDDEYPVLSYKKTGEKLGFTQEGIRQIEKRATRKIRESPYLKELKDFLY